MGDSFNTLNTKYQLALVSIRELELQNESLHKQVDEIQSNNAVLQKNVKRLCETILKKDRGAQDERAWFKVPILDMIAKAQSSIENYFPSVEGNIKKLLAFNGERTAKIAKLQKELDSIEDKHRKEIKELTQFKDSIIEDLKGKLISGRIDEEEVNKLISNHKQKQGNESINVSSTQSVEFTAEKSDMLDQDIMEALDVMYETGDVIIPVKQGPKVNQYASTDKKTKDKINDLQDKQLDKASQYANTLSDVQRLLIRTMGETGFSELKQILDTAKDKYPNLPSESRLKFGMHALVKESGKNSCIDSVPCSIPGSPNLTLYKLNAMGKDVFSYLFGKDAVESELELTIRNHGTLEHGYGIRKTAELFEQMEYVKKINGKVISMTRSKEYAVKTGENTSYIPDIIIISEKNGKEIRRYIEYETGKCNETDFFAKCNKIASFSKYIAIVVPKNDVKEEVIKRINKWKTMITETKDSFPAKGPIRIQLATFYELRDKGGANIPWSWEKMISPPKD